MYSLMLKAHFEQKSCDAYNHGCMNRSWSSSAPPERDPIVATIAFCSNYTLAADSLHGVDNILADDITMHTA